MDKRRYVARRPRRSRSPVSIETAETGNPAVDGYTVRERQSLDRDRFGRDSRYSEHYASGGLMTETDAMMRAVFEDE